MVETLIMSFRFDIKFIATILLLFIYIPALFFISNSKKFLFNGLQKVMYVVLSIVIIFSFLDFGYYLFFGNEIDVLVFGLMNDGNVEVLSSLFGDMRLIILIAITILFIVLFTLFYRRYI